MFSVSRGTQIFLLTDFQLIHYFLLQEELLTLLGVLLAGHNKLSNKQVYRDRKCY